MKILYIKHKRHGIKEVIVDDDDYVNVICYKWNIRSSSTDENYYVITARIKGSITLLHRYIMNARKGQEIDHKDRNTLNNSKSNLRFCTRAQNGANRRPWGKSKYIGVNRNYNKWEARLRIGKKYLYLGRHETEEGAALAYNEKAKEIHGEFANINNICSSEH